MTSTIHVEDRYVVKAGESLHFRDQTGIELDGDGWNSSASLVLNGAVTVVGKGEAQVSGVVDTTLYSSIEIGRRGTLTVTSAVTAIGVDWATTLDNAGAISATTTGGGMAAGVRLNDGFGTLTNTGSITASGGQYTYGVLGGFEIHNRGSIVATSQAGDIFGAAVQSWYLDNQGRVEMSGAIGIGANVSYLDNGGLIRAESPNGAAAVILQAGGWLHNSGRIVAEGGGEGSTAIGLAAFGQTAPTLLENSGLIVGDIAHGRIPFSPVELDNSGRILGDVWLGWGADQVHDGGLIKGEVQLLDGDDVFQVEGEGRVTGAVHGDGGDDLLVGGARGEALYGDGREESEVPGADTLQGNDGADTLAGGAGGDVFVYAAVGDSTSAQADLITDLEAGDSIDLSAIDADTGAAGDQAFHLVAHFSGRAGETTLSYVAVSDVTVLSADVDGDRVADLVVRIEGDHRDFAGLVL